jgi:hypothetical protein
MDLGSGMMKLGGIEVFIFELRELGSRSHPEVLVGLGARSDSLVTTPAGRCVIHEAFFLISSSS